MNKKREKKTLEVVERTFRFFAVRLFAHEATEGAREGKGRPVLTAWDCRGLCAAV